MILYVKYYFLISFIKSSLFGYAKKQFYKDRLQFSPVLISKNVF